MITGEEMRNARKRIIKEKQEELNSTFWNIAFCRIKFHRGVEFNFASEE